MQQQKEIRDTASLQKEAVIAPIVFDASKEAEEALNLLLEHETEAFKKDVQDGKKLPRDFKKRFLIALRDGSFRKVEESLILKSKVDEKIFGYCALGVAGKLCGLSDEELVAGDGGDQYLPRGDERIPLALRISSFDSAFRSARSSITFLNDNETFENVANWVEANL